MRHELIGLLGCRVQGEWMIDVLVDGERHVRVRPVHRTGGCVHQVLDAVMAASLDDVQKAGYIAGDIDVRIFDRIAHARLSGEMDYAAEVLRREQGLDAAAIDQIALDEAKLLVPLQYIEPRSFEARIVVIVQVIEPDYLIAARKQSLRDVKSNESCRAGDQDLHMGLQSPVRLIVRKQVLDVVEHMYFLRQSADFTHAHRLEFVVPDGEHDRIVAGRLRCSDWTK